MARPKRQKTVKHVEEPVESQPVMLDACEMESTVEQYSERLNAIFQYYCAYGEPLNTTQLKSSKWMKMLKDVGLIGGKWTIKPPTNDEN